MSKELEKKQILPNSRMPVSEGTVDDQGKAIRTIRGPKYDPEAQIKKYGLKPVENFEYVDPVTGDKKSFTIDRRGSTEASVGLTLLDPKATREQKDSAISMYLFEKGKHSASLLMDLWSYKGIHTKESRAFQSTMRFDFELFLQTFQMFMQDSADLIFKNLPIEVVEAEVEEVAKDGSTKMVTKEIVKMTRDVTPNDIAITLGEYAQYFRMTSRLLGQRIRAEVQKRERAKGKGIYLGEDGKPYSIREDDDIVEVVAKDKAGVDKEKNGITD